MNKSESVIINGQNPLNGRVSIQGSKNAALPILAASVLFKGEVILHNVPNLADIHSMLAILEYLGATHSFDNGVVRLNCSKIESKPIPEELSTKLRASSLLLGPLLSRFGKAEVAMPGGCKIGTRPMDIHFKGFEKFGATYTLENGFISLEGQDLEGEFTLEFPSVGATENLVAAAVHNSGRVVLRNFAKEPEVLDLIRFLQTGGARIAFGEDHSSLIIEGVKNLFNAEFTIQPDRIEAGTFLVAAFATKGNIQLNGVNAEHLSVVLEKLTEMGAKIEIEKDKISLAYDGKINGVHVKTEVYPGFPTDLQSQFGVLMTQSEQSARITETVYERRFTYVDELLRMNAKAKIEDRTAYFEPSQLSGCRVEGYDLRGTASMIIAGLLAEGVTHVSGLKHMYRGYEAFVEKLQHLGADIGYV